MSKPINLHSADETIVTRPGRGALIVASDTVPTGTPSGYSMGCLYICTSADNEKLYINTGTDAAATWTVVGAQTA
tara:strand:- start:1040 stop:1264 length:225 start_codon:yes stop_codon:yes gene_type:complete